MLPAATCSCSCNNRLCPSASRSAALHCAASASPSHTLLSRECTRPQSCSSVRPLSTVAAWAPWAPSNMVLAAVPCLCAPCVSFDCVLAPIALSAAAERTASDEAAGAAGAGGAGGAAGAGG
ncbi:hypothetical protein B484DRAFT_457222 [Ochromonadaceae sp. CCMP2298]|nr:hypothetical protein B484DRAFT_457222 [Ochromonadaceae sp. CCMP2298]